MKHRFGKKLTFMFINTSNVFYDKKTDSYAYYDTDSYDVYNQCRNTLPLLLKLDVCRCITELYFQTRVIGEEKYTKYSKAKNRKCSEAFSVRNVDNGKRNRD